MVPKAAFDNFSWVGDDEPGCKGRFYPTDEIWPGAPANSFACRRQFQAMLSLTDSKIGALVGALKERGLWNDTLMTFMADNGGSVTLTENAANNWPLRGGKYSPWEGGIRVVAFVSGGYLPPSVRGTVLHSLVHIADYYMTFCKLAGLSEAACAADPLAEAGHLPPIDSLDLWPMFSGANLTSPRTEVPIASNALLQVLPSGEWYKLLVGSIPVAGRGAPVFPNSTSPDPNSFSVNCSSGCLFDVMADPTEAEDLASLYPDVVAAMTSRLEVLARNFFSNNDTGVDVCPGGVVDCACWAATNIWGGFLGPWQES